MNKDFFSKERFKYIIILALFNYIFLGTEYLFDNIVGDIKPQSVVTAQSYILGASVLGFLFFAIIKKYIIKIWLIVSVYRSGNVAFCTYGV